MDKARKLVEAITYNNRQALVTLAREWGYEVPKNTATLTLIYELAFVAQDDMRRELRRESEQSAG